eukprot:1160114-Pelagomonas_calceolata.AAC.8
MALPMPIKKGMLAWKVSFAMCIQQSADPLQDARCAYIFWVCCHDGPAPQSCGSTIQLWKQCPPFLGRHLRKWRARGASLNK